MIEKRSARCDAYASRTGARNCRISLLTAAYSFCARQQCV